MRGREAEPRVAAPAGAPSFHASDGRRLAAAAVALILALGGFIFYNTNVLNGTAPRPTRRSGAPSTSGATDSTRTSRSPDLTGTNLRVEIYPERRAAEIRGTYLLVNHSRRPIDSIHLATVPGVETGERDPSTGRPRACSRTTTSATASMRWRSRSSPATRCS